jgi:hypothetical protein
MRHPFGSGYTSLFSSLPVGFGRRVRAGGLVVASEVAFDEVTVFKGVFDWVAMVVARRLDDFDEADVVDLASLLLVGSVDRHDELAIAAPLAVLLAFPPPIAVLSLVYGFGLSLALVLIEDCSDGLLVGGMAFNEVEPFLDCPRFALLHKMVREW